MQEQKREIKFRFYSQNQEGRWSIREITLDEIEDTDSWQGVSPWKRIATCQYTGLLDRNGKEIYEGDILESDIEETLISIVWDYIGAGWHYEEHNIQFDDGVGRDDWRFTLGVARGCKIIGNIYQNPELLNIN